MSKAPVEIRSLARSHTDKAIKTLANIMDDTECPPAARVAAAQALLDRGWGKPNQSVDHTITRITAREIGDNELAAIAAGGGEGVIESPRDPPQLN